MRDYRIRVDVLRNGACLESLQPVSDPVVDCNADGEIKTSMAGQFLRDDDVNWFTDELKPYQIIDGAEYPVGVFPIGTVSEHVDENGLKTVSVEAYDRALILKQKKTETILHFDAGMNYVQAVEQLLVDAGIILYMATSTAAVLATDREDWDVGTSYLEIVNTLLQEINYRTIWFNADGWAMIQPAKTPSASNIDHQYGTDPKVKILKRSCSVETDAFDTANVFIVICDNPDLDAPLTATAINDNPMSSLSTFKRGRRIVNVSKLDNIPNQAALEDYAQRLCLNSMLTAEMATVSTANLPGHEVLDTVALNHPDLDGIFQEVAWSLVLAPGQTMLHTLRRSILV